MEHEASSPADNKYNETKRPIRTNAIGRPQKSISIRIYSSYSFLPVSYVTLDEWLLPDILK